MTRIKGTYPNVKIHLFGKISLNDLEKGYYHSADAATWADAAAYGQILYWDQDENESHTIYMGSTDRMDSGSDHYKNFSKKRN